jgi:hypothetical protein
MDFPLMLVTQKTFRLAEAASRLDDESFFVFFFVVERIECETRQDFRE